MDDLAWSEAWTPAQIASRLRGFDERWAVAGGWAIDLFAGGVPRAHADLEVVIAREAFPALRAVLGELEFHAVGDGEISDDDARLMSTWQTWGLDRATWRWRVDVMREPWSGQTWVYRRDPRIRCPLSRAIATNPDDIPYLVPEIVLLFKAKRTSRTDERDLATALPRMNAQQRTWLQTALETERPGHPWLDRL